MSGRFEATVVIDRPIEEVFAFLANGENDPKFSARVLEIAKTTDGPPGVGTVYASTVKDAGMKTKREFEFTEFVPPTRIRWAERSKNIVTAPEGGYDLVATDERHAGHAFNVLRGTGSASSSRRSPCAPPAAARTTSGGRSRPPSRRPEAPARGSRHSSSRAAFAVSGLSENTPSTPSAKNCSYSAIAFP